MARGRTSTATKNGSEANLGFEEKLWAAADIMRGHMDPTEYEHVALGLIFLKYDFNAFEERYETLRPETHADPESGDEHLVEIVFQDPQDPDRPQRFLLNAADLVA